jgi:broad specificity phosphatase PhoE
MEDPGDLVIVAHLGVLTALSGEIRSDQADSWIVEDFPTGSVTAYETPEWLWGV